MANEIKFFGVSANVMFKYILVLVETLPLWFYLYFVCLGCLVEPRMLREVKAIYLYVDD